MRTGPPSGPDLALLRELHARNLDWFLTGRVAATVQGVPLGWSVLDIQTAGGTHADDGPYGGTYGTAYDDTDPRTGSQSADVSYREDPARPVTESIRRALAASRHE